LVGLVYNIGYAQHIINKPKGCNKTLEWQAEETQCETYASYGPAVIFITSKQMLCAIRTRVHMCNTWMRARFV
jgi:hypothetical protein